MVRLSIFVFFIVSIGSSFAQTGPGGVGSSANTSLWLKADAGTSTTTNGTAVSTWNDNSGNANHASQATANQQPIYTSGLINGMPALFFDNIGSPGNDLMTVNDADNLDNTAGLTILTVTRPISIDNSSARAIVSKRVDVGNNQSYTIFYYTSNHINIDIEGNDNRFSTPATFVGGRDYVFSVLFDGSQTAANRVKTYLNETLDVTATETGATISNFASPVVIGSMNVGDGRPFGGYIAEVIIYRKALNAAERIIAHNYLFAKYGLNSTSIPATINDVYAGDEPTNGNYDYEVCGVGRESSGTSGLVSSAVSGGIDITAASGYDIGDYLMFGHASGANSSQLSDVGGMTGTANARWSRIWYFDLTNTSTNQIVNLFFDMSDAGTPVVPVTASNYVLLYRAGQSGNWTEVTTASSISGDRINFPGITVTADGYYTLGSRNYIASPLPITLVDFTGENTEKGVELTWTTASETNNDHFTIQRSADGLTFTNLSKVAGAGQSDSDITYHAFDTEPFAGKTYYRLQQTDFDGRVTDLKTIAVTTSERPGLIEVVPNPSDGNFWFELPAGVTSSGLKVLNSGGQEVPFFYTMVGTRVYVDAKSLPRGLYLLKLISDRGMHSAKFIIE